MAEVTRSEASSPDTDKDFEPTADMLVHEFDDERTLEEEEAMSSGESCAGELDDLQKESDMPLEDLLAHYAKAPNPEDEIADNSRSASTSSSEEEILENQDLTLDKEVISRDLLNNAASVDDRDISVNELIQNVSRSQTLSHTERLLRSTSNQDSDESESSSEDEHFEPIEEHKKTIQVGSDFQAVIPVGLSAYGDAPPYENEDRLLWDPSKIKEEEALDEYLCNVQKELEKKKHPVTSIPRGKHIRDDEQALFMLLQCDNNIEEAERRRKMQAVPATDVMSLWSEDECRNFEDGLRLYGKSFHEIHHSKVRTRSVFELVHFYYLWKKTERHDVFAAKTRAEKRKYSLNPGVTDHMDRFLEEQEVELSQSMIPQVHDLKSEFSNNTDKPDLTVFSTGKPTIYSPTKQFDRNLIKSNGDSVSAGLKRSHHQTHEDINNSNNVNQSLDGLEVKKQKMDSISLLGDIHSSKRAKDLETIKESSHSINSSVENRKESSQSPISTHPLSSHSTENTFNQASEIESEKKLLTSVHTTGPSFDSAPKAVTAKGLNGFSKSEEITVRNLSTSPCKSPGLVVSKPGEDSTDISSNADISNCVKKSMAAETVSLQ